MTATVSLREQYDTDGYVHLRGVFDASQVDGMRAAVQGVIDRATAEHRMRNHAWKGAGAGADDAGNELVVRAWHNLEYHDARFLFAACNDQLCDALEELIGPDIVLHHSKMLVKPPAVGAPFPMHQDAPYFPHEQHTMLAASVHLDDADERNGCLHVLPGSHAGGALEHEGAYHLDRERYPLEQGTPLPARAGDVLVFNYLTVHGSGVNRSDGPRRNILFQYRAAGDRPAQLTHIDWGCGLVVRGCQPRFVDAVPQYEVQSYAGLEQS